MASETDHPLIPQLKQDLCDRKIGRRHFLRSATLLGLSASAATAFAAKVTGGSFVAPARAQTLPRGGTIKLGMRVQEITRPHALNWVQGANITMQVVETLTRTGQDNLTRPHLAARWEASPDLRTWTIHLRPEAKWHSGRPFLADDVVWNLRHILDPATGSSSIGLMKSYLLSDVKTGESNDDGTPKTRVAIWDANAIETVDDLTVRLNLKNPTIAIPEDLFFYCNAMLDPEENGQFGAGSNGTGAFELAEHEVGIRSVLRARGDAYYGDGPHVDELWFVDLGDDPNALVSAIAAQQVHGLYQLDGNLRPVVDRFDHVQIYEAVTASTCVVQMKVKEKPFDDPRVRLAMRYGIDPEQVLRVALQDLGLPAEHHFVCPIHPEYAPLPKMERDPTRARQLLAEAGYPDGIDVEMFGKPDPAWEPAGMQVMKEQYAEAGIRVKLNVVPSSQFWDLWDKVPLGFVEWAHRPLGFTVLSLGFRTGVPWNAPEYANPAFDALLTQAEGTLDVEERRKVMAKIQTIMQQDGPIAQPCWRAIMTPMHRSVQNFRMHPAYFFFGNELAIET